MTKNGGNLLLLSNSNVFGRGYLEHAAEAVSSFLSGRKTVHFAPFALADRDAYTARARAALTPFGVEVVGLHTLPEPARALADAEVIFVGGGNSFRLVKALHELKLIDVVHQRVTSGELLYMGSSAGTNMACPTLRTTNDMPIVEPPSFRAFGLVPFQINPHYVDPDSSSRHMGETREKRIEQFLEENDVPVVGMREGAWLSRQSDRLTLGGDTGARVFRRDATAAEFSQGDDLSFLLDLPAKFDTTMSNAKTAAST